jgi:hypothetical protein
MAKRNACRWARLSYAIYWAAVESHGDSSNASISIQVRPRSEKHSAETFGRNIRQKHSAETFGRNIRQKYSAGKIGRGLGD